MLDGQGVVFNNPLLGFLADLADATGQRREAVARRWRDELRDRAWRGGIPEDELWRELACGAAGAWGERLESAYGPGPAAPRLPAWAARVPIWLLTNHRTAWVERRLDRTGLGRWLDRVLVSDALGALKPEAAAFAPVLARVPMAAAVMFVDDQARNIAAAAALGCSALLADPAGHWLAEVDRRLGV